jgi:hypothetical protein
MKFLSTCTFLIFIGMFMNSNGQRMRSQSDKLQLIVDTGKNLLAVNHLMTQEGPSFRERGSRAAFIPILAGFIINKGVQGIQTMINDRKSRYIAGYSFAERGHYFYDQISTVSAIDPVGLQFKGFQVQRVARNEQNGLDTILLAKFILDTTEGRISEIMNSGLFHLKLDSIRVKSAKVKLPRDGKGLNLDFEIVFNSSFRGDDGQIHPDAPLGRFIFTLRNIPLDLNDPGARLYYDSLDKVKPTLVGESFLVPRSSGFYKNRNGNVESCWGQGLYSINVNVKETSKVKFIDKLIIFSSDPTLSLGSSELQKNVNSSGSKPTPSSSSKSATKSIK